MRWLAADWSSLSTIVNITSSDGPRSGNEHFNTLLFFLNWLKYCDVLTLLIQRNYGARKYVTSKITTAKTSYVLKLTYRRFFQFLTNRYINFLGTRYLVVPIFSNFLGTQYPTVTNFWNSRGIQRHPISEISRYPVSSGTQGFWILMFTGRYPGIHGYQGTAHAEPWRERWPSICSELIPSRRFIMFVYF